MSFKAIEHYSEINGVKLEKFSGVNSFGNDYLLSAILYALPFKFMRKVISFFIRLIFKIKSKIAILGLKILRKFSSKDAKKLSSLYYKV